MPGAWDYFPVFGFRIADGRHRQLWVTSRSSVTLDSASPILARSDDRNSIKVLHVEQITVNTNEQRTLAADGRTQDRYIGRIPAHV